MTIEVDVTPEDPATIAWSDAVYTAAGRWQRSHARCPEEIACDRGMGPHTHAWFSPAGLRQYRADEELAAEVTAHRIARAVLDGRYRVVG